MPGGHCSQTALRASRRGEGAAGWVRCVCVVGVGGRVTCDGARGPRTTAKSCAHAPSVDAPYGTCIALLAASIGHGAWRARHPHLAHAARNRRGHEDGSGWSRTGRQRGGRAGRQLRRQLCAHPRRHSHSTSDRHQARLRCSLLLLRLRCNGRARDVLFLRRDRHVRVPRRRLRLERCGRGSVWKQTRHRHACRDGGGRVAHTRSVRAPSAGHMRPPSLCRHQPQHWRTRGGWGKW